MAIKFDSKTMRYDKRDSKVIYDSKRGIGDSVALTSGYVVIGVKGNPSASEIRETIRHEKAHLGGRTAKAYLDRAVSELRAYTREKSQSTAKRWNAILPIRIKDFMPYISWLSKTEQRKIGSRATSILSPKVGGGNLDNVTKARRKLAQFWL